MNVEIIAHRGASFDAPENTLAAINLAWTQGADAVEVDIQLSRDREIIVVHDADTRRTTGRPGNISDKTLAELHLLDAGRWKDPQWRGERLPTLTEVLDAVPDRKRLFVEVKCGPDFLPPFKKTLSRFKTKSGRVVPIGFSAEIMKRVKQELPELEVCLVAEFKRNRSGKWRTTGQELIDTARAARLDGLDLGASGPIDAALAQQIRAAGLSLYVWTVDSPARARRLIAAGVQGITTNRPGWLRRQLEAG